MPTAIVKHEPPPTQGLAEPPDAGAVARFMAALRAEAGGYPAGDRQAIWTAQRRESWSLATLVAISREVRAWHDQNCPGRTAP